MSFHINSDAASIIAITTANAFSDADVLTATALEPTALESAAEHAHVLTTTTTVGADEPPTNANVLTAATVGADDELATFSTSTANAYVLASAVAIAIAAAV